MFQERHSSKRNNSTIYTHTIVSRQLRGYVPEKLCGWQHQGKRWQPCLRTHIVLLLKLPILVVHIIVIVINWQL